MNNDVLHAFEKWLVAGGAKIVPALRDCELLRFKHGKAKGVLVVTKNGAWKPSEKASKYLRLFEHASPLPPPTSTSKSVRRREARVQALLIRDGSDCFYCGGDLGDDRSIEHLVSKCHSGPEHLSNLCLAHSKCNLLAGNMPVVAKIRLREERYFKTASVTPSRTRQ